MPSLRRAVRALDLPDFVEPVEVLPLSELHEAASTAWSDYLAGRHAELLATAYRLAAGLSGRLGLVDLAAHAAHRALETARYTNRPELDEAAALRYLAWVLIRQGDLAEAERIAVRAAERLDGGLLGRPTPARRPAKVPPAGPDDLLKAALAAAARSGVDRVDETGVFGPRVAGHQLHLAASYADLERWRDVIEHLEGARDRAPQWSRMQPLAQTVLAQLIERRGRRSERISALAAHYGSSLPAD